MTRSARGVLIAVSLFGAGCSGSCKSEAPMEGGTRPTVGGTRLVYTIASTRAPGLSRAFAERLRVLGIGAYQVRVAGNEVSVEVDAPSVARVKSDFESAVRIDFHLTDDDSDPLYGKEKEVPFPALVAKETRPTGAIDLFLRTPREHDEALVAYAGKATLPKERSLLVARRSDSAEFVRTYLVREPSIVGGECVETARAGLLASGAHGITLEFDKACVAMLTKETKGLIGRVVVAIDGRVCSVDEAKGPLGGRVELTFGSAASDRDGAARAVERSAPRALTSAMKLVKEEKL